MQQQKSFQSQVHKGTLYLVPTPIGNLDDMTYRAVATLSSVDLILAEDTRNTQKLLNHFEIKTPQWSFHEHNTRKRIPQVLEHLQAGESIAQVSDAGMPIISDPGSELVTACIQANIPVVPLPGANAALTGLIASGIAAENFTFIGFMPRKKKDQNVLLETLRDHPYTLLFYESPYRIMRTIETMITVFGETRQACVVRELTKRYEEFTRGTLAELSDYYTKNPNVKGEICLVVAGSSEKDQRSEFKDCGDETLPLKDQVTWWMSHKEMRAKEAIKEVAKRQNLSKQEVYRAYHFKEEGE